MPRNTSRARWLVSLASLALLVLAMMSSSRHRPVLAEDGGEDCPLEGECTIAKPNLLIVVEYSAAMNSPWDAQLTPWEWIVQQLSMSLQDGGLISQSFHVALLRFAHDPDPDQPGTPLPGTDLVDGLALDHGWTDPETFKYLDCQGSALTATLAGLPAPSAGTGTWTRGALLRAVSLVEQTRAEQGEAPQDRAYLTLVYTQGTWTNAEGDTPLQPAQDDPAEIAGSLYDELGVPVYVSELGDDPAGEAAANALASAGGTVAAFPGEGEDVAISEYFQFLVDQIVAPDCTADRPRVLVVLDASSSMLDFQAAAAPPGAGAWDQARSIIVDDEGFLEASVQGDLLSNFVMTGLLVSGGPAAEEQRVLVPYGDCYLDEFAWALDPESSCEAPLCRDPWGGPPITWTPATAVAEGPCGPSEPLTDVFSHMPRCDGPGPACTGSGSFLHLGLQLAASYQAQAHAAGLEPDADLPTDASTRYVQVLITDGYSSDSTDAQVQTALEAAFSNGITTYVIGIGEPLGTPEFEAQLTAMAAWGSSGSHAPSHVDDLSEVEAALVELVEASFSEMDPCCPYTDCHAIVECLDEDSESSGESESESESSTSGSESGESESGGSETSESGSTGSGDSGSTASSGDEIADDSTDGGLELAERGCSCESEAPAPTLAPLLLLGLLGLRRRR